MMPAQYLFLPVRVRLAYCNIPCLPLPRYSVGGAQLSYTRVTASEKVRGPATSNTPIHFYEILTEYIQVFRVITVLYENAKLMNFSGTVKAIQHPGQVGGME